MPTQPNPKPPDISPNPHESPGPSYINYNSRTLPLWMDSHNKHGDAEYLLLQGINNASLPRKPLMIGTSIELTAGGPIASATSEFRGKRYALQVRNRKQAEKLLEMVKLIDDTPVEVIHHPTRNICKCVVTCWDMVDTDIADIKEYLQKQGVVDVRRITRQIEGYTINTGTMILTCAGTTPPKHITFGALRVATRVFYPSPILCFKCYSFGHTKNSCKNNIVCRNCSDTCETPGTCNKPAYCKNCKQNHSPVDRSCPIYKTELEISKIKVDEGLTYPEARDAHKNRVTKSRGTYANALQQRLTDAQAKSPEITTLTNLIKQKDEANKLLQSENQELRKQVTELQQTLNQLLEGQNRLQDEFRQHVKQNLQQSKSHYQAKNANELEPNQSKELSSKTPSADKKRMLTRLQRRNEKQNINNEADTQSSQKKRTSKLSAKPPKLHRREKLDISFSSDESDTIQNMSETENMSKKSFSDEEMVIPVI